MASAGAKISKLILDIQDCVQEIKLEFNNNGLPIDDGNAALHRLCDKLEHLLQTELKEKFGLLGNRKNYWDYFCKCLASRRGIHDGLKYAKSVSEFKTALGRGRAFIRYCLVHQCLADTLQQCLLDGRITSDFYNAESLLLQYEQTSCLISTLYELNEVQFDISSHGHDLDVSWPTYSRSAHSSWRTPSRTVSLSSLTSIQSDMNHSFGYDNNGIGYRPSSHLPNIESSVVDLLAKVDEIQQEQAETKDLARKTHDRMDEVAQSESWWQDQEVELKKKITEVEHLAGEYAQKLEAVQLQREGEESLVQQVNSELEMKVKDLEYSKCELELQIDSLKKQLSLKEEVERQLLASQESLKSELEQRVEASFPSVPLNSETSSGIFSMDSSTQVVETDLSTGADSETNLVNDEDLTMVDIKALREENERFKSQTEKWKKCLTGFAEKLAIKERVNGHLEKQVEALKDALAAMKDMMQVKTAESDSLKNLVQELKNLREVQANVENSDERVQTLENENIDLKENMANLNTKFDNLKQDLDSNLKLLSDKETSLTLMLAKTQEMGLTLTQTEDQVAQLKQQLDASSIENQTLNRRLDTMREMLRKVEKAEEELEKLEAAEGNIDISEKKPSDRNDDGSGPSSSNQYTVNFVLCDEHCLLPEDLPVMTVVTRTVDRLQHLIAEKQELQLQLRSSNEINSNLISKVQEQEEQLTTVTFELCEAKALVERLKVSHNKLQTSEAILRYELKEKRSVVERMKQMLESSRAQWMRIRQKHTESQLEWQSLRADFASRVKQESVDSGTIEDSNASKSDEKESLNDDSDRQPESPSEMTALSSDGTDMDAPAILASSSPTTSELEDLPEAQADVDGDGTSDGTGRSRTRTRLRIMEEQCRLLYSKLVASVKKSEFLEWKLSQLHIQHGGTEDDENSLKDESESSSRDVNANFDIVYIPFESKVKKSSEDTSESQESIMDGYQQQDVTNSEEEAVESLSGDTDNSAIDDGVIIHPETHLIEGNDYEEQESLSPDIVDNKVQPLVMAQALPKRIELLRRKKEDLELNMKKMTEAKSESDAREADLLSQLSAMKLLLLERESLIDCHAKEKADMIKQEADFKKRETEFNERADSIIQKEEEEKKARFQAVMKAKEEVQIKLGFLQNQIEEKQGQIMKLEAELCKSADDLAATKTELQKTVNELVATKASLEQELTTLQFQVSSSALRNELGVKRHAEHEKRINIMQEQISGQEDQISLLENELKGIKQIRNEEMMGQKLQMKDVQMSLSAREEECASLNDDLKKINRQYDIERIKNTTLSTEHEEIIAENCKLKDDIAELYVHLNDMKASKMKLVLEKDLLWKRSEHLSFIHKVQTTDRWVKDDEVQHCQGCKAEFTFILRKHHCRRCGKVYCKSCCNRFVMTTASRHRVRVCNDCLTNQSQVGYEAIALDNDEECGESSSESIPVSRSSSEGECSGRTSSSCTPDREIVEALVGIDCRVQEDDNQPEAEASDGRQSPTTSSNSTCTDEKSIKDRSLLSRLFDSWSQSPKSKAVVQSTEDDFYFITDEEIMTSLSHSCPYVPSGKEHPNPRCFMCPIRPLDEVLSEFSSGQPREIWLNAGKSYAIPILISELVTVTFKFTSEPKSIAFSLVYHALPPDFSLSVGGAKRKRRLVRPTQVLHPITHCNSHLNPVLGRAIAKKNGIYTFYLINEFSRFMAKKVSFILNLEVKSERQDAFKKLEQEEVLEQNEDTLEHQEDTQEHTLDRQDTLAQQDTVEHQEQTKTSSTDETR